MIYIHIHVIYFNKKLMKYLVYHSVYNCHFSCLFCSKFLSVQGKDYFICIDVSPTLIPWPKVIA